jgi:hypothetical protein
LRPGPDGRLSLRGYYEQKYTPRQRAVVRQAVEQLFPGYSAGDLEQAVAEVLAYQHQVYHRTRLHHLDRNHALVRRHEGLLRDICRRFEVPVLPVLAIVGWENSGGTQMVSWADAAGLGQMTWGAVDHAHSYAARLARDLLRQARQARQAGDLEEARRLAARAQGFQVAERHRRLARQGGVEDERLLVECNLEDSVLFLKFLLESYGGRPDHAIAAYHNGVLNTDLILQDYLRRQGEEVDWSESDRSPLLRALERHNITFLTLWRDTRCRQMLNGLRTVDGDLTTPANASYALVDESDIYLWKVVGSLSAYLAGEEWTRANIARHAVRWDLLEVSGLPSYTDLAAFEQAARRGHLVPARAPLRSLGAAGKAPPRSPAHTLSFYVTPEMDGYLWEISGRLRRTTGNPDLKLPVASLSKAYLLGGQLPQTAEVATHLRGVAVDLVPGALDPEAAGVLEKILWADYLMDRVYLRKSGGIWHVTLNPRRGDDFLAARPRPPQTVVSQPQRRAR